MPGVASAVALFVVLGAVLSPPSACVTPGPLIDIVAVSPLGAFTHSFVTPTDPAGRTTVIGTVVDPAIHLDVVPGLRSAAGMLQVPAFWRYESPPGMASRSPQDRRHTSR